MAPGPVSFVRHPASSWVWLALVVTSCPFLLAVEHQQTTLLSLGILTAVVVAWRSDRPMIAGLLVGLLSLKPQLAFAVGLTLWIMEGRRALLGMVISAVVLAAAGEILSPGATRDFLTAVPAHAASLQMHPGYNWGRQMTPTAFLRTMLGADSKAATLAGHAISAALLVVVGWKAWTLRSAANTPGAVPPGHANAENAIDLKIDSVVRFGGTDVHRLSSATRGHSPRHEMLDGARIRAIILAFLTMPLCAPYFMDYDLLLLVIPFAMLVSQGRVRLAVIAGAALWLATWVNVELVAAMGVNGVVVLLGAIVLTCLKTDAGPTPQAVSGRWHGRLARI